MAYDKLIAHYNKKVDYTTSWLERWHLKKEFKVVKDLLNQITKQSKFNSAIDIACHNGRYSFLLSSFGLKTIGIDSSEKAINAANNKKNTTNNKRVTFLRADATKYKIPKTDIILIMELLHHLSDKDAKNLFQKALSSLNPNGYIIFDLKNKQNPYLRHVYKKESSKNLLLIPRTLSFYQKIIKNQAKIVAKKALLTKWWKIEPFVIIIIKK